MQTPTRILRAEAAEIDPSLRDITIAQEQQREKILAVAQHLMIRHGPRAISFTRFAHALKIAPSTLRRFFCDLDELLAFILTKHLADIARAMGEAAQGAPNPAAARRAAYLRVTRAPFGGLTPAHHLFTACHQVLPPDLLDPLRAMHWGLGNALCPSHPHQALALLDAAALTQNEIETAIAAFAHPKPQIAKPQIAPPHNEPPHNEPPHNEPPHSEPPQASPPEPRPEAPAQKPADPTAPIIMRSRDENRPWPRHPDDVYVLRPGGRGEIPLVHAPPTE